VALVAGVSPIVDRSIELDELGEKWTLPGDEQRLVAGKHGATKVIGHGRDRGIGVTVYVNRLATERQLDQIVNLYEQWGVRGIKFGFLREGTQTQNDWIFEAIRRFGEGKLLVNAHDNLRPAGLERTLPNYITMEGVRGNEQFPTARHNVALAHTRNLNGPIDYTICYEQSRLKTTSAHQLAMPAVYYSALSWLYWYAPPTQFLTGPSELSWFDALPTTWDESRALSGEVGRDVAIARRHGDEWYLGAMTNETRREIEVPLDFLGDGHWIVHRYADAMSAYLPQTHHAAAGGHWSGRHQAWTLSSPPASAYANELASKISAGSGVRTSACSRARRAARRARLLRSLRTGWVYGSWRRRQTSAPAGEGRRSPSSTEVSGDGSIRTDLDRLLARRGRRGMARPG
jgi:hypothetical protein